MSGSADKNGFEITLRHQQGDFTLDVALKHGGGGVTALFGPSGAGKTTVINAVAGLIRPDDGYIRIGNRVLLDTHNRIFVPPHKRRVGYVFQDARLLPHLSVRQNLIYGQRFARAALPLDPAVEMLGISHLLDRSPKDLSGGEAQRVAIGRALLSDPELLLMDEPLAALDEARRNEILPYLDAVQTFSGTQILYVSHAMSEVARLADMLVLMQDGQVSRSGPVEDILADPKAISQIGVREAGASVTARLVELDAGDGLSRLATSAGELHLPRVDAPPGTPLRVRILASDIMLATQRPEGVSALNILPVTITAIHDGAGPGVALALQSGQDRLVARITRRSAQALALSEGMACYAVIKSVSVAHRNIGVTAARTP